MPVYGLAENSVALAFPPAGRGPRVTACAASRSSGTGAAKRRTSRAPLRFVSVGAALPDHEIRLVDDAGATSAKDASAALHVPRAVRDVRATSASPRRPRP